MPHGWASPVQNREAKGKGHHQLEMVLNVLLARLAKSVSRSVAQTQNDGAEKEIQGG